MKMHLNCEKNAPQLWKKCTWIMTKQSLNCPDLWLRTVDQINKVAMRWSAGFGKPQDECVSDLCSDNTKCHSIQIIISVLVKQCALNVLVIWNLLRWVVSFVVSNSKTFLSFGPCCRYRQWFQLYSFAISTINYLMDIWRTIGDDSNPFIINEDQNFMGYLLLKWLINYYPCTQWLNISNVNHSMHQ